MLVQGQSRCVGCGNPISLFTAVCVCLECRVGAHRRCCSLAGMRKCSWREGWSLPPPPVLPTTQQVPPEVPTTPVPVEPKSPFSPLSPLSPLLASTGRRISVGFQEVVSKVGGLWFKTRRSRTGGNSSSTLWEDAMTEVVTASPPSREEDSLQEAINLLEMSDAQIMDFVQEMLSNSTSLGGRALSFMTSKYLEVAQLPPPPFDDDWYNSLASLDLLLSHARSCIKATS